MSARNQADTIRTLDEWRSAKRLKHQHDAVENVKKMAFIQAALADGWSWIRIGVALDQTATASRRWHDRNKAEV